MEPASAYSSYAIQACERFNPHSSLEAAVPVETAAANTPQRPGSCSTQPSTVTAMSALTNYDKWKGIGVRIEDDILVTKDGNENLTKKVPSDPKEIESLMS